MQIGQYVCDRLGPPPADVERYLSQLIQAMVGEPVAETDREAMAAAILVSTVVRREAPYPPAVLRNARRGLLRIGFNLDGDAPDLRLVHGFARILTPHIDRDVLWLDIRSIRTFQEEIRLYHHAGQGPYADEDFPALATLAEWPELARASEADRKRMYFLARGASACPRHCLNLPTSQAVRLKECGIGRAANCCDAIILCEEI